jgi:hypothetical protein
MRLIFNDGERAALALTEAVIPRSRITATVAIFIVVRMT